MGQQIAVFAVFTGLCFACGGGAHEPANADGNAKTAGGSGAALAPSAGTSPASGAAGHAASSAATAGRTVDAAGHGDDEPGAGGSRGDAGGDGGGMAGSGDADELGTPAFEHEFEPFELAAAEERTGLCQSWTLENPEPVLVNTIRAHNRGGVHHSNWMWVPDDQYPGPDGTWPCDDRGFEQVSAGAVGGVFFAQSTQSREDLQRFPEGAAFRMPAHVRIIGNVHALNVTSETLETSIGIQVFGLAESDLRIELQPMAFTNLALEIAPAMTTHARMQCAVPQSDFEVYYVLPHFHALGLAMSLDAVGGPQDGEQIWRSRGTYGEPLGETFDPPLAITGATGLGITCEYQNASDRSIGYGVGDQEMCVILIYAKGSKAGGTALTNLSVSDEGGIHRTDGLCLSVSL